MARLSLLVLLAAVAGLLAGCITPAVETLTTTPPPAPAGFSRTDVFPGQYVTEGDFSVVVNPGALDLLPQEHVLLESEHDGAQLEIGVVRPDTEEKVPVVAFLSPYLAPLHTVDLSQRLARLVENFVPHGYAVAAVPVRGTANHGGCMDLMGNAERADLDQAVTWLGTQEWSNGNVAVIGVSYDGSTPWEVASLGNPHLKTIVPISGVNDLYHLMFRNGTNEFRGPVILNALYYTYGFAQNNPANGRDPEHVVQGVLCPESLKGLAASVDAAVRGERDPLGFWAERNSRPGVEANYKGSIFHVQGLQDWNVDPGHNIPWVLELEEQGLVVKHLYGQWSHMWPDSRPEQNAHARWDWAEILLRWFDRELKGLDVDVGPRVQVEDSEGNWRSEDAWPPADAVEQVLYLTGDGKLAGEPGAAGSALVAAPACGLLAGNPGCVRFETEAFETGFRFAGMPQIYVPVVPGGPGGHLTAYLYVVDGSSQARLGWGQVDLRFAQGGEKMNLVVPGQRLVAGIQIEPLDAVVPEGAKLVLELHQGSYGDHIGSAPTYPAQVQVGGEEARIHLLTFARGPDAFFLPPGM